MIIAFALVALSLIGLLTEAVLRKFPDKVMLEKEAVFEKDGKSGNNAV
jgi:hypothetical protein